MKLNVFLSILSIASAASYCPSRAADPAEQLSILNQFIQKFYINKDVPTAFADHFDRNYIEHNPNALSGWNETNIAGLAGLIASSNFTIMHSALDNNAGYVHFRQDTSGSPPTAIVDVVRFNGSCIVEHWDVSEARPENTVNPLAMW